jgi:acetyltransferase-like isoleucine patch superfamily enzyme
MYSLSKVPSGQFVIEGDWFPGTLPANVVLHESAYPDTSYSFANFFSEKPMAFSLGIGSGNYGHGIFVTGKGGEILVGDYVVLQCTRIESNRSVSIGHHSMLSWGSVVTDSWLTKVSSSVFERRNMLHQAAFSRNRHVEFLNPEPVVIEENVWIGFEAVILPGVKIGRGAVIGCKTIVTEDVPPYAVAVGNPMRIIKYLEPNDGNDIKMQLIAEFIK